MEADPKSGFTYYSYFGEYSGRGSTNGRKICSPKEYEALHKYALTIWDKVDDMYPVEIANEYDCLFQEVLLDDDLIFVFRRKNCEFIILAFENQVAISDKLMLDFGEGKFDADVEFAKFLSNVIYIG